MNKMRELAEIKKFKIDKHTVTTTRAIFEDIDIIVIYYDYNNNMDSITLYYDLKKQCYLYHYKNILTDRQKKLLENKINKYYIIKEVASNEK
jgi:hypothetical protein